MIKTKEDFKKYVPVAENFPFEEIQIYFPKAIRAFIKKYVGNLYKELEDIANDDLHKKIKEEAQDLLDTAVANFSYYLYTPYVSVTMDSSGFFVVTNDKRSAITSMQLNDIRRELLRSGHEAMDELLEVLEHNADVFTQWHNNYSTIYRDSLVYSTSEFNKVYNIFNSRQTFLSLKPSILNIEEKMVRSSFNIEFLESLKSTVTGTKKLIKEHLQKAIIHGTVAKVCAEGVYSITPTSIVLKFDLLDYERKQVMEYTQQIKNAIESNTSDMNGHLMKAYEQASTEPGALIENKGVGYQPIITKSIIGI